MHALNRHEIGKCGRGVARGTRCISRGEAYHALAIIENLNWWLCAAQWQCDSNSLRGLDVADHRRAMTHANSRETLHDRHEGDHHQRCRRHD